MISVQCDSFSSQAKKDEAVLKFEEFLASESMSINEKLQGLSKLYKVELSRAKFD